MTVSLIRTLLLYLIIIIAVRLMGKRQISELQTTELVVTLLISDIASIPMQNTGQPLVSGLIPIAVLICCEIFLSIIMLKNSKFRRLVCGKPVIVINDGNIDQKQMKRLRMTTEDLMEELRQLDVFNVQDISYAIIETNGKMSILKKAKKQQPDASALGITIPEHGIDAVVISDGEISDFSVSLCGLTNDWIYGVLQGKNLELKDVFLMTANRNKNYYIVEKEKMK